MELNDTSAVADRLVKAGLSQDEAAAKSALFSQAAAALRDGGATSGRLHAWFIPGRIEVLGKHTDYAGGRSLICTVERGFCLVAWPRQDNVVRILDVVQNAQAEFAVHQELTLAPGHWSNYPKTVARRVARNFPGTLRGAEIALASDLPAAAGMSSSSALIVASFLVLARVNQLSEHEQYRRNISDAESLANYLGTVENGQSFGSLVGDRGVGTFGGSEDHTAILCSRAGQISQYGFCPARLERRIAIPRGYTFVIGSSGVVAEKTGLAMAKYNRVSRAVSAIVELAQRDMGAGYRYLADVVRRRTDEIGALRGMLSSAKHPDFDSSTLIERLEQFYIESELLIPAAGDALERAELQSFGSWVRISQHLAEVMLGNQVPQTAWLARAAREYSAEAASAFGAGFGGSVWAMVPVDRAVSFIERWTDGYRTHFPDDARRAEFFLSQPGPAAVEIQQHPE